MNNNNENENNIIGVFSACKNISQLNINIRALLNIGTHVLTNLSRFFINQLNFWIGRQTRWKKALVYMVPPN
jgi:hypothetical protein